MEKVFFSILHIHSWDFDKFKTVLSEKFKYNMPDSTLPTGESHKILVQMPTLKMVYTQTYGFLIH